MPSKSPAQARLMRAIAHNPEFAKKVSVPQNVGQEFAAADAAKGNLMATKPARKMPSFLGKTPAAKGKNPFGGKESPAEEAKEKKQFPGKKAYAKAEEKFEGKKPGMKCGGKVKKYADGGGIEEGPNANIDDDTRARALRAVRAASEGAQGAEGERVADPMRSNKLEGVPLPPAARRAAPRPAPRPAPVPARPMAEYTPSAPNIFDPAKVGSGPRILPTKPTAGAGRGMTAGPKAGEAEREAVMNMIRKAGQYREEGKPGEPAFIPGMGGVGRAATSAIRGMGKAPSAAPAEIGKKIAERAAAAKASPRALIEPGAAKASPRARSKFNEDEAGVEFQRGGSVRGGGAAKRGVGRGKMC